MTNNEFHQLVDLQLAEIEALLDGCDDFIDYEITGNVMTVEFDDNSQIIINKQEPLKELWLAGKTGAYHFAYINQQWICQKSQQSFMQVFNTACEQQSGQTLNWQCP